MTVWKERSLRMGMDKFLGMLGLAHKAGKTAVGTKAATDSIRSGKARLAILASDTAENARKRIKDACNAHQIPCRELSAYNKETIGAALGIKSGETAAVAVTDAHFVKALSQLIGTNETTMQAGNSDPQEVQ